MSDPLHVTLTLSPEQVEAIVERVAELVAERQRRPAPASPFLTRDEAAEILRCRARRIYELVGDGRLTRHGDGRRLLVSREEVERLADGG